MNKPIYPTQLKGFLNGSITAFSVPLKGSAKWTLNGPIKKNDKTIGCSFFTSSGGAEYYFRYPVGTILVCREPWKVVAPLTNNATGELGVFVGYKDKKTRLFDIGIKDVGKIKKLYGSSFQPANHMPYAFSRCKRVVIANKVERARDLTVDDVRRVGINDFHFLALYADHFNAQHGTGSWESNPWVERPTVRRIEG